MCNMHYLRWYRGKDMHAPPKGVVVGNKAAHIRIRKLWGKATEHVCVGCGGEAHQWAYDGTDPTELPDPQFGRYSLHPEFYMPMCRSCHARYDRPLGDCTVCGAPEKSKGLCKRHYQRQWDRARARQRKLVSVD